MTRVLVWKEIREQWTSAAAFLLLGVGLILARDLFGGQPAASSERAVAVMLVLVSTLPAPSMRASVRPNW